MNTKYIFVLLFVISCSTKQEVKNTDFKNKTYFLFKDLSGEYVLKREVISKKNELLLRQSLFIPGSENKPLEKTVTVTRFGSIRVKNKNIVVARPLASQHTIWYEKKEYFSQMKLNLKLKRFDLYLKSPEEKWKGKSKVTFPKGIRFCWFTQIPECLKKMMKLNPNDRSAKSFYIVWDSYPYYSEQLKNMKGGVFSLASIAFDGDYKKDFRFAVWVDNQTIYYHFNKNYEFEKMLWINQGITMIRNDKKR